MTQLVTSTPSGGQSSGQLLIARAFGITTGTAFTLDFVVKVVAVDTHNLLDSAAALMGSLTGQDGTQVERSEMIYIDADKIGRADDSASASVNALDGLFHTYRRSEQRRQPRLDVEDPIRHPALPVTLAPNRAQTLYDVVQRNYSRPRFLDVQRHDAQSAQCRPCRHACHAHVLRADGRGNESSRRNP